MRHWIALIPALALAISLAACGSSGAGGSGGDDTGGGDATGDTGEDPDVSEDLGNPDIGTIDTGDTGVPDVIDEVDLADVGEACDVDDDCVTQLCVDVTLGGDDGLCSQICEEDADCPRDFDCIFVDTSGGDAQSVCLPVDLCIDGDLDGYGTGPGCMGMDCDDADNTAYFGAEEVCDSVDNDCDGDIDDNPIDGNQDCDTGFAGQCAEGRTVCNSGIIECMSRTGPSNEMCDDADNDCDGSVDENDLGMPLSRQCYDGDPDLIGTGVCQYGRQTCQDGGYSACIGQRLPDLETCDGFDNDCDGFLDEGNPTTNFYPDTDMDGFGDANAMPTMACVRPAGFVENFSDCNDADPLQRPGAAEIPGDGVDQNCDGSEFCFEDVDQDGYRPGSMATTISLDADCADPGEASTVTPQGDCDDDEEDAFPGNPEACDFIDNDCNDRIDEGAMCYPLGDSCTDASDCISGLCEGGICTRELTCVETGACPDRFAQSNGNGSGTSENYIIEWSMGGNISPILSSERYRMTVGTHPYVTDP